MTEYVAPNIHTVLKKYQTSAPKSLQGPGHALPIAGCQTGPNCPLDATLSGVSGSAGNHADLNTGGVRSICSGHLSVGNLTPNGSNSGIHKISPNCPQIVSSQSCLNSPNAGSALPPVAPLIKKEVLSSPEPHELGEILPLQSLPLSLPLSMSSQTTQPQSQTVPSQPPVTAVKIIPPPPPELSQPIFTAPDSGSGVLYETRLEGKTIGCFSLGGEMRLCLPQFLNNVLADFTLDQINRIFDELGIYCSQCSPDQLLEFKAAKILPTDVKASGLITRTDAERLCAALLHRVDRNSYISDDDIPKGAISFKVYHRCFGKCDGICTPELYSYTKPTCIMCLECKGWFSPQKFVGHVHREVENRTCHWGFDSRNWHDYLHVALDVENREKYQKILDELKEVEIKEALKAQNEMLYMKRKHALHVDDEMITSQMGHSLSNMAPLPHQLSNMNDKQRTEMLAIPTKKAKGLEEAAAYQLEYQHYQSLMYAHCAQQQRIGSMSAFRPWAPKSFLHPAATYNAVSAFSTLPYLSQEPPVLQNPERVVRSTDRERFERTYQPNVALVPRKCVLAKDREKEQREYRERERDRERVERERDQERSREREKREQREQHEHERGRREREIQQMRQQHLLQQQTLHQQQQSAQELQEQVSLANLCPTELKIKQERANTPNEMPQSPPAANADGGDGDPSECRINTPIRDNAATLPIISPIPLTISQQQRKMLSNNNSSSNSNCNSNSNSCHSDVDVMHQQQQQQQQQQQLQEQQLQPRRHSLYTSNSSASSTSSTASTTPPQQQLLPAHLPPSKQYQQEHRHVQALAHQEQQIRLQQSPRTCPLSPTDSHSSQEFAGSNEITSSTSPAPCNESKHPSADHGKHYLHGRDHENQPLIATVNQHAKLLPTPITANFTASNNSNHNELHSRIRISKNLINRSNIIRSPTPPPPLPPTSALSQLHAQQEPNHTSPQQLQILQQQQYEFYKHNQRAYDQQRQQQQQSPAIIQQQQHLIRSQQNVQLVKHSPSQSSTTTGLNLSTHSTKVLMRPDGTDAQNHHEAQLRNSYNGLPYVGSEFELSTDTDDDSVNGEADSSNILAPWDMAVEALRDTGPKERDRVLGLLRKVLHENQQLRYSNIQLSEMIHKRDTMIRELREQLQTCRHHLQFLSLQEPPNQSNGLDNKEDFQDEEARSLPLRKSSSVKRANDFVRTSLTKENVVGEKGNTSRNDQFSDSEDDQEVACISKESDYDDDNGSDKESEKSDNPMDNVEPNRSNADLKENLVEPASSKNDVNENDIGTQPQPKRSRIESGSESNDSLNRTFATNKVTPCRSAEHTSHGTSQDRNFDSEDEASLGNGLSDYGNECSKNKSKVHTQISNADLGDDEADATRFAATNGSGSDTNTSDDDGDENNVSLMSSHTVEADVQTPSSNTLSVLPTAGMPLSPHSAATAGQLFDSSNSSDELSMKKAQMSASDALAKISESADDGDELAKAKAKEKTRFNEVKKKFEESEEGQDSAGADLKTSDNCVNVKADTLSVKVEQNCTRGGRFISKSSLPSGKSHEVHKATKFADEKFVVNIKVNNNDICSDQRSTTRTPLATKASKKETPTTNTELWVKEEVI